MALAVSVWHRTTRGCHTSCRRPCSHTCTSNGWDVYWPRCDLCLLARPAVVLVKVNGCRAGAVGRGSDFSVELGPQVRREAPLNNSLLPGKGGGFGLGQVRGAVASNRLLGGVPNDRRPDRKDGANGRPCGSWRLLTRRGAATDARWPGRWILCVVGDKSRLFAGGSSIFMRMQIARIEAADTTGKDMTLRRCGCSAT